MSVAHTAIEDRRASRRASRRTSRRALRRALRPTYGQVVVVRSTTYGAVPRGTAP